MNWFLQRLDPTDVDSYRAARLVVAFSIGTAIAGFAFVPILYYFTSLIMGIFAIAIAPIIGSAAFWLRRTGDIATSAQIYLSSLWALITGVAVALGGIQSPAFPSYSIVILGATFTVGRRAGVRWTIFCLITMVVIQLAQKRFLPDFNVPQDNLNVAAMLSLLTVLSLICLFSLQYDDAKNQALGRMRDANRRVTAMIAQLEHASERLIKSSERFVGTPQTEHRGLISDMLEKARDGRDAMDVSREAIYGMIEQYRQIAGRVQLLQNYSRLIVEVLSTIDRISDRLDIMALNVGIEASHSGESAKQFTILAGDMRILAERMLVETGQIKVALQNVREHVQDVLDASASGQVLTEEAAKRVANMGTMFNDIYSLIERTEVATGEMTDDMLAQIDAVRNLVLVAADDGVEDEDGSEIEIV